MPSKYWSSLEDAPLPAGDAGVSLEPRPTETLAVSIFGGYALGPTVAKKRPAVGDFRVKNGLSHEKAMEKHIGKWRFHGI